MLSSRARYADFVTEYRQRRLQEFAGQSPARAERGYLRAYVRWLRPHRVAVSFVLALAITSGALQMVEPLFLRFVVDRVLLQQGMALGERLVRLQTAGLAFLAVIVAANLTNAFHGYRVRVLNVRVTLSLRRALFHRLLRLPLPSLWNMKTGGILSRLTGDVETTSGLFQMAVVAPSVALVRLFIAIGVLFTLNWRLALMAVGLIPGIMLVSFASAHRVRPIYRALRRDAERIDGRVGEAFAGIRVVRAFRRETAELLEYLRGQHTVLRKSLFADRRELALKTSWGLLLSGVNVAIVWYGGRLYVAGRASIGDIMAFQLYTVLLLNPVWSMVSSFSELQRALAAMERVFDVLALPPEKQDQIGAKAAPPVVRDITFEHVEFAYRAGHTVVHDFSVSVRGGSVVALVGRSGAGKTTITDLVTRFHDPTGGRILINGEDLRTFRLGSYRNLLAIVQQDVFLFDGSVRDNIAYSRHATDAEVQHAARLANAHVFIADLPEGYETFIGERGVKLSGGQQQRLSIARAFLKAPQILILDEATSNLDTESEQLIQASMAGLLAGRTTFVIAHRLSTVRRADLILLMERGRVTERGTHEDLMAARGAYYTMVMRQIATGEDAERMSAHLPSLLRECPAPLGV